MYKEYKVAEEQEAELKDIISDMEKYQAKISDYEIEVNNICIGLQDKWKVLVERYEASYRREIKSVEENFKIAYGELAQKLDSETTKANRDMKKCDEIQDRIITLLNGYGREE